MLFDDKVFVSEDFFYVSIILFFYSEHTKNARKSTKDKHEKGQARRNREQQRSDKKKG